ncbi:MAG: PRC-barrel domain containing protein [Candidatus Omnitrophica bacterium]|nr:PRC-barrel domain containing protein [Candidatus Omnitrophota bacterium]
MLRSLDDLRGYELSALDGDIGSIRDVYFDDTSWTVQYFVVDTGGWLSSRKVLISPAAVSGTPDDKKKKVSLLLTRESVKRSPDIDVDKPVSRRKEIEMMRHYRWPVYWQTPLPEAGAEVLPGYYEEVDIPEEEEGDRHLRSFKEVEGYNIHASDGDIGHVYDLIAEDKSWNIRYMAVDTGSWLPGRKVLISPSWVDRVEWDTSRVYTGLVREHIQQSPRYDPGKPVDREYEKKLYDHYERLKYWSS